MNAKPASSFEHSRELALQLFASQGFGQVSLRKLAAHMGLSTAALYSHCGSKEELLFEALEEHYENILAIVSRALRTHATPKQHLQQIGQAMVELHRRNPCHFQLASRERHCLSAEHQSQVEELRQRIALHLLRLSSRPVDNRSPRSQSTASLALNLLEQLPQWLTDANLNTAEQLPLIEHLIQGVLAQLSAPQGPNAPEEHCYAELQRRSA
jgi:AcrR family transcriptional regulator